MSERAWDEYLAWTRGAAEGQYEVTEARAWERLQAEILRASVVPTSLEPVDICFEPDEGFPGTFTPE